MGIKEGDRFIWNDSVHVEVTKVMKTAARIACRTHPFGQIAWTKEQPLPFPETFILVGSGER